MAEVLYHSLSHRHKPEPQEELEVLEELVHKLRLKHKLKVRDMLVIMRNIMDT